MFVFGSVRRSGERGLVYRCRLYREVELACLGLWRRLCNDSVGPLEEETL